MSLQKKLQREKVWSCQIFRDGHADFMYYKNKKVAASLQKINSCTKSIVSALVGIALEQGLIEDLDTPIHRYFPELNERGIDERKRLITLDHLLTMSAGFDWPEFGAWNSFAPMVYSQNQVRFVLERPLADEPGERMNYNSGCSHLLSAILQQVTQVSTEEYAQKVLFRPLGITETHWYSDGQGISKGGDGLRMRTEDLVKFGLLHLEEGRWNGRQVVPAAWVRQATAPRYLTYENIGHYGSHWWASQLEGTEEPFYFALGYGGQYILVVPGRRLVVVFTSEMYDRSLWPLRLFREEIVPAYV